MRLGGVKFTRLWVYLHPATELLKRQPLLSILPIFPSQKRSAHGCKSTQSGAETNPQILPKLLYAIH